jgi:hypothetical protein
VKLDQDGRISSAQCSCNFYKQNALMQGPCEHILCLITLHRKQS